MLSWRKDKREDGETAAPGASASESAGRRGPAPASPAPAAAEGGAPPDKPKRLGEMLCDEGYVTPAQVREALARRDKDKTFIGKAMVDLGFIDQKTLQSFLVKQCKIPHISLLDYDIKGDLLEMVPEELCLRRHLLPIDKLGRILTVAMVDPLDSEALEEVRAVCPELRIKPILCDWDHFVTVSGRLFSKEASAPQELTAKSLGLSESKPKARKEPDEPAATGKDAQPGGSKSAPDSEQAAVEAAVEALLQDAQSTPTKVSKKASNPDAELADLLARQKPPTESTSAGLSAAPPAAEARPRASVSEADLAAVVRSSVREAVQEATASAVQAASTGQVPVTELAAQMREGMEQVMQQAVASLAAQLRENAPAAVAGPSPQEMAELMQRNLQEALGQTLAPVLEGLRALPAADKGAAGPSAQELAAAIGGSVREAIEGTIGGIAAEIHRSVPVREDGDGLSVQDLAANLQEGIRGAMQEAVAAIVLETRQSLQAQAKAQPSPDQLADKIRDSVHDALRDVVTALSEQTRMVAASRPVEGGGPSPQALSEAIRAGVQEAMSAALEQQARQLAALDAVDEGPSAEDVAAMLGTSVRSALHDTMKTLAVDLAQAVRSDDGAWQEALARQAETSARSVEDLRAALEDSLKGLTSDLVRAVRPDDTLRESLALQARQAAQTAEDMRAALEAMREAMQATQQAQAERESRLTALLETALKPPAPPPPPPVPETAPPAAEEAPPSPSRLRKAAEKAAEKLATVTVLSREDREPRETVRNPEVLEHSDERVRAALDAESPFDAFRFDGYYVGKNNAFTFALARSVAEAPGGEYNPLFVYGDVGTGKTHLINAIANEACRINRDLRVGYVQAGRFARRLVEATRHNELEAFREGYCRCDMLLFDDVQFLAGNDEVQEEFFHIFNALLLENRQIVLASDKAPDRLGGLEKRLVSRFAGGIVAGLTAPDWETRLRILHRQAQEAQVEVPDDILALIATRVPSDIRKMTGCLRKLIAFAKLVDQDLTCDLAGEILTHLGVGEAA